MDMVVYKNGSIWILEYGTQWFATNPDARLSRIDYVRGNRPPIPSLQVKKSAGAAPFAAVVDISKTQDYDGEYLEYTLDFGDGTSPMNIHPKKPTARGGLASVDPAAHPRKRSALDSIVHYYTNPGNYEVTLKVKDAAEAVRTIKQKIFVGNEPPLVYWNFNGKNRSFYQPGQVLKYHLEVSDAEDGSLLKGNIFPAAVATTVDYLETGFDITSIAQGHQAARQTAEYARGKLLISRSDCGTCHAEERLVNGPSYTAIAERYRKDDFAVRNLSKKVIKGGAGNWGETVMSAHPQVSEEDAGEMVRWILSLGSPPKPQQAFPLAGDYTLSPPPPPDKNAKPKQGTFIFKASYRDRGSSSQAPLEHSETIALRPAYQQAEQADSMSKNIRTYRPFNGDTVVLNEIKPNSFFMFKHVDLTGVHGVAVGIGMSDGRYQYGGGRIEARLGSGKGKLLGQVVLPVPEQAARMTFAEVNIPLETVTDGTFHDLYFVLKNENNPSKPVIAVDWVRFDMRN
jgi:cytochrome c